MVGNLGSSPGQSVGAIDSLQKLIAGQLRTKQRQAQAIGLPEDRLKALVGNRAYGIISSIPEETGTPGATTQTPTKGKPSPAERFKTLTTGEGKSKADAYRIMHQEGY